MPRSPFAPALCGVLIALFVGPETGAKPLTLRWCDPCLRFSKGEQVVYEIRESRRLGGERRVRPEVPVDAPARTLPHVALVDDLDDERNEAPTSGPAWGPASTITITFVIADVDPVKREYTVAPAQPQDIAAVKDHASMVFDMVSQLLPGGPVPPFDPHMKKRGLVMAIPPPPGPPAPLTINQKGEFTNRDKVTGEPGELIGEARFEAQIAGEILFELEPCVQLTGLITKIQHGALSSVEWIELIYSPARGRMIKAVFEKDFQRTTYHLVTSQAAPVHPPQQAGITPWFPPLPDKVRVWLTPDAQGPESTLPNPSRDRAMLEGLRGALPLDPRWYGGILPALAKRSGAPTSGETPPLKRLRRSLEEWDEGLNITPAPATTLLPSEAEGGRRLLTARSAMQIPTPGPWTVTDQFPLTPLSLTPSTDPRLTVDPDLKNIWLEREDTPFALRTTWPPVLPAETLLGIHEATRWSADRPGLSQPGVVIHAETHQTGSNAVRITLKPGAPSNALIRDSSDARQCFLLGVHSASPGASHLLLSAWNPASHEWMFQDRWIGGVSIEPGVDREVTVQTAVDASRTTLVLWVSCGLLICVDARSGDLLWSRVEDPAKDSSGPRNPASVPIATEQMVGRWMPDTQRLTAFDRSTGARLWDKTCAPNSRWCGVNLHAVYLVSDHACEALDPLTGSRRWRVDVPTALGSLNGEGAVSNGSVIVPFGRSLIAFDVQTGAQRTAVTRTDEGSCHVLTAAGDPGAWWLLTTDRLERYTPRKP